MLEKITQAKAAVGLMQDGLLDLTVKEIAFRYSLAESTIFRYSTIAQHKQS